MGLAGVTYRMARILVIDDDTEIRSIIAALLAAAGHDVEQAGDGDAGLKRYHPSLIDLVITDIEMPKRDGFEVMMDLRARGARTPVIAISDAFRIDPYLEMARLLGAACTLEKPFRATQLLAAVAQALAR